jgi:hypothetical protein
VPYPGLMSLTGDLEGGASERLEHRTCCETCSPRDRIAGNVLSAIAVSRSPRKASSANKRRRAASLRLLGAVLRSRQMGMASGLGPAAGGLLGAGMLRNVRSSEAATTASCPSRAARPRFRGTPADRYGHAGRPVPAAEGVFQVRIGNEPLMKQGSTIGFFSFHEGLRPARAPLLQRVAPARPLMPEADPAPRRRFTDSAGNLETPDRASARRTPTHVPTGHARPRPLRGPSSHDRIRRTRVVEGFPQRGEAALRARGAFPPPPPHVAP